MDSKNKGEPGISLFVSIFLIYYDGKSWFYTFQVSGKLVLVLYYCNQ